MNEKEVTGAVTASAEAVFSTNASVIARHEAIAHKALYLRRMGDCFVPRNDDSNFPNICADFLNICADFSNVCADFFSVYFPNANV
jgi:hypothetical protein